MDNQSQWSKYRSYSKGMSVLAIIYGPLQFLRIITQNRWIGILDQWITLPFFMLGSLWALEMNDYVSTRFAKTNLMVASVASYWVLAPNHPQGFDIALGVHIFLIIGQFINTYLRITRKPNPLLFPSAMFLLSCFMFVVPKLLDHLLAKQFPILFGTLTGHFWSKIGDFMQIHYAQIFFLTAERYKPCK